MKLPKTVKKSLLILFYTLSYGPYIITALILLGAFFGTPYKNPIQDQGPSVELESGYWFDENGPHLKPFLYNPKDYEVIDELET